MDLLGWRVSFGTRPLHAMLQGIREQDFGILKLSKRWQGIPVGTGL
jgi:hypothetical protein